MIEPAAPCGDAASARRLIDVRDLAVRYTYTPVLQAVAFDLAAGEVHAVVGENGAGKSTLLRALAGMAPHATGHVRRAKGIRITWVPQETDLPPDLTVTEWVFLGREVRRRLGWLDHAGMRRATAEALRPLGCDVSVDARLGILTPPQRKQVQLARALHTSPDVLLLDEPTAVLGDTETAHLFAAVRTAKERGAGVAYVSHRLDEVLAIADRVTVLRDGRHVSTDPVTAVNISLLVQRMVGRALPPPQPSRHRVGATVLRATDLAAGHVRDVSLTVHAGEIVGLAGLVGAGRSEVLEAIAGIRRSTAGVVVSTAAPRLVPEDRARKGLVAALNLRENVFLPADTWRPRPRRERQRLKPWTDALRLRASGPEATIDTLSGGNQQKALLARTLRHQPQLLLLDEPTAGVDIAAKADIHEMIRRLAADGAGIVIASSDLPELLTLCDRIVAMRGGCVAGTVPRADATEAYVAALITGAGGCELGTRDRQ